MTLSRLDLNCDVPPESRAVLADDVNVSIYPKVILLMIAAKAQADFLHKSLNYINASITSSLCFRILGEFIWHHS